MAVVKNLMVRAGFDASGVTKGAKQFNQTLKTMHGQVANVMSKVRAAISVALAVGMGKLIKDSASVAMKTESSIQQINRAMNVHSKEFLAWANTQALAFNMAKSEATQYGAVYSNLISGFEQDTKKVSEYTQSLLKSSAVVASGTGRTMEDVMERIRSGMLGNTESIEDLGINVNIAMIESTNAFKKFANGKSWQQLSFQTQQQIRLFAIMEQASKKYGDSINKNTASDQQQFIAQLKNTQLSLGQAFLPIYQTILPALTNLAAKLASVMNIVAQFSQALFGKATAQAKATDEQANAVSAVGDAYTDASKAAKNAVAGFDEVNQLSTDAGSVEDAAESAAGTGVTGDSTTDQSTVNGTGIVDSVQTVADKLKNIFQPVINAFEKVKAAARPVIDNIGKALQAFYTNVLVPFSTWVISEAVPAFLNLVSGALKVLNPLIVALQPLATFLWNNFLQPIAAWTGGAIITVLDGLADALTKVSNWMSEHIETVRSITIVVGSFLAAWKLTELLAFIQTSGGVVGALQALTKAIFGTTAARITDNAETVKSTVLNAGTFIKSLATGTAAIVTRTAATIASTVALYTNEAAMAGVSTATVVWQSIMSSSIVTIIKGIAQWVVLTASMVASTVAQTALTIATGAWNVIAAIGTSLTTAFGVALAILTSPMTLIIVAIAALVAGVILLVKNWDKVKEVAANVWNKVTEIWGNASSWFGKNVGTPISNTFSKVWDGIKSGFTTAFDFIKNAIKWYINTYISIVEGFVNFFIKGINLIIGALNKIHFDIPDWVPGIGGASFGINIPLIPQISLPRLAEGGITNGPMPAWIGDNPGGQEVVSPLNDLKDIIVSAVSTAVLQAMQFTQGQNLESDRDLILNVDGTRLARVMLSALEKEANRQGKTILQTV